MPLVAWFTLIALSFIFIFVGLAIIMFFTFYFNDGASPGWGVAVFLLAALVLAVVFPNFIAPNSDSPIIPSAIIAGAMLVAIIGASAHFLLPSVDNKDAVVAARPLIIFTYASGILVAAFNLVKIIIA